LQAARRREVSLPLGDYPYAGEDDEYEYYIIHDSIGV
jgi:hypothetical protein